VKRLTKNLAEQTAKRIAKYYENNPVIFKIMQNALNDNRIKDKTTVIPCILDVLEKIAIPLLIDPAEINNDMVEKANFTEELKKISQELAANIDIMLTLGINASSDIKIAKEYMGKILSIVNSTKT